MFAGFRRMLVLVLEDQAHEVAFGARDHRQLVACSVVGIGFFGFTSDHLLKNSMNAARPVGTFGIVLDVVLGLVLRRELEVTVHRAPRATMSMTISRLLFLLSRPSRGRLRLGRRIDRLGERDRRQDQCGQDRECGFRTILFI